MKTDTHENADNARTSECPQCGGRLESVKYPGGYLNREQWESLRAGDFVCRKCPDNGKAIGGNGAYFWQSEVNSTPPQPASYGEPWLKSAYNAPLGDSGDYEGVIEIYTKDNAMRVAEMWNPEDENERAFDRTITCVNACQGIADPEKAIQEIIAAVSEIVKPLGDETETSGNPCVAPNPSQGRRIAAALHLLNGRAGE